MAKKRSGRKSMASKPRKKARVRRGFANTGALAAIAPAGLATQAAGGFAGFIGTGYAVGKVAQYAAANPNGMLAKLGQSAFAPVLTRALIAVTAGWALRRFVSKPVGNAVAVGGLINAGASLVKSQLGPYSPQLLGIGQAGGIDPLHPEAPASLGEMDDATIQGILEEARAEPGMGDIPGNGDEGNLSPGVLARVVAAA